MNDGRLKGKGRQKGSWKRKCRGTEQNDIRKEGRIRSDKRRMGAKED